MPGDDHAWKHRWAIHWKWDAVMSAATFSDKLGATGTAGDRVIVPICNDHGLPQLAIAEVVEVVVREPNPLASELSVRTRVGDDESCVYEPDEVVLLAAAGTAP
jgi:hypothetical protein